MYYEDKKPGITPSMEASPPLKVEPNDTEATLRAEQHYLEDIRPIEQILPIFPPRNSFERDFD